MCEEDRFEKTANELEEVLKRKFPDVSPPTTTTLKSQPALKPTTNSTAPILTPSHTIKQEVKEEPGKFNYINHPGKFNQLNNLRDVLLMAEIIKWQDQPNIYNTPNPNMPFSETL